MRSAAAKNAFLTAFLPRITLRFPRAPARELVIDEDNFDHDH
jgi:hypothetical protein